MKTKVVRVLNNYEVVIDTYRHTLMRYEPGGDLVTKGKYKGQYTKPRWVEVGYFPNMQQCLRKIVKEEYLASAEDIQELEGYIETIDRITNSIEGDK